MDYDATLSFNGLQFGLLEGKCGLLIVKTGSGGTIYGHANKYLLLASQIHDRYDFSVIVGNNPLEVDATDNMEITMYVAKQYSSSISMDIPVYYFGISKGAQYAAMYGYRYDWVAKWLLLNMPLMINWHRSSRGLSQLSEKQQMVIAFGENDPSFPYSELIDIIGKENISKVIIPKANHNFSQSMDDFMALPEEFLFQWTK